MQILSIDLAKQRYHLPIDNKLSNWWQSEMKGSAPERAFLLQIWPLFAKYELGHTVVAGSRCNYRNAAVLIQPELLNMYALDTGGVEDEPATWQKGRSDHFKEKLDFRVEKLRPQFCHFEHFIIGPGFQLAADSARI